MSAEVLSATQAVRNLACIKKYDMILKIPKTQISEVHIGILS